MNLPVLSVVAVYGLANRTRLVSLLLEDVEGVRQTTAEGALRIGIGSHRERVG